MGLFGTSRYVRLKKEAKALRKQKGSTESLAKDLKRELEIKLNQLLIVEQNDCTLIEISDRAVDDFINNIDEIIPNDYIVSQMSKNKYLFEVKKINW